MSEEQKKKIGEANKGKKRTQKVKDGASLRMTGSARSAETRAKMRASHLGKTPYKMTDEIRLKMSLSRNKGRTALRKRILGSKNYISWRTTILVRDNYTCQLCNKRGGDLQVDHFPFPFAVILSALKISTL